MTPIQLPPFWETLIKRYLKKTFYQGTRKEDFALREAFTEGDHRFFSKGVAELNLAFTSERAFLPAHYFNQKQFRSGYIFYFLPINAAKVAALLDQTDFPLPTPLKVLDVGSGPGTGMLGTFHRIEEWIQKRQFKQFSIEWTLWDQSRQTLDDAVALHDTILETLQKKYPTCQLTSKIRVRAVDLKQGVRRLLDSLEPQDLVLCLNLLSELPREKRTDLVNTLLERALKPSGRMLIMEPALRGTTRDLMELHDELLERESAVVYAPCLHQKACPMLQVNQRDWCHVYIPWVRPVWIEKIDRFVAIQKSYLICSYLFLGKDLVSQKKQTMPLWRVVSGPLNSKGKSERLLCGDNNNPEIFRIVRLDRDSSQQNQGFDRLERGDLVSLPKNPRIFKDTKITPAREPL